MTAGVSWTVVSVAFSVRCMTPRPFGGGGGGRRAGTASQGVGPVRRLFLYVVVQVVPSFRWCWSAVRLEAQVDADAAVVAAHRLGSRPVDQGGRPARGAGEDGDLGGGADQP